MSFLSFSEKVKLEKEDLIIIYRGRNQLDKNFFAYILCNSAGLAKMRSDYETKKIASIVEYGKVIYLKDIADPDGEAEKFLDEFVVNYHLIKDIL